MKKKRVLLLGYKKNQIVNFLRKKNIVVIEYGQKKITSNTLINNFDLIISYGYNKIINERYLKKLIRPPINLHISYLPYNRGSHPNFWSFVDKTPSGVTIHEINSKVDAGAVIYRKKIKFNLNKGLTFRETYKILNIEIQKLFMLKFTKIINRTYYFKKTKDIGTFHLKKDLPKNFKSWDTKISEYIR